MDGTLALDDSTEAEAGEKMAGHGDYDNEHQAPSYHKDHEEKVDLCDLQ
jgi:hypothetical protein